MLFDDHRLLFFDNSHIESTQNVVLTLNPPVKRGPCLFIEKDWELNGARAYCITEWQGEYRLYYDVNPAEDISCYGLAVSKDGISWERPELGIVSFNGSTANNLVDIENQHPNGACVFVDPTGPDEHRFKILGHNPHEGMFLMTSPDGLRFKRQPATLLAFNPDSLVSAFYDRRVRKYRVYLRAWDRTRPIGHVPGSRVVALAETDDLFKPFPIDANAPDPWHQPPDKPVFGDELISVMRRINRELPHVIKCDEKDPRVSGLYQSAAVQYLPNAYLAFPTLYYSYPGPPEGFINDGVLDIQFAASRDGVDWRRDLRGSYVRLDLPDGPCTRFMHMLTGMVPSRYELSQYYVGHRRTHGQGRTAVGVRPEHPTHPGDPMVHRLEQRMDGFVSADSAYAGGMLMTGPFVLDANTLQLNVDTSASGVAHAALLAEDGSEIPGFSLNDCDRIQGNDTEYAVSWNKSSDLSQLRGRPIKLLLRSRSTKLFAIYPKEKEQRR